MTTQRLIEVLKSQTILIDENYKDYHSNLITIIIESIELQGEELSDKKRVERLRTIIEKRIDLMEQQ